MKISVAMIVKNVEDTIEDCLDSVKNLVDEIVVVDTGSSDNTLSILSKRSEVTLAHFEWCDDFSAARNFSIEKTTGDYVLVLDADEYIVEGSREELENIMSQGSIGKILIDSKFKKNGQEYQSKTYVSRFFSKDIRYVGIIHEQLDSNKPRLKMNLVVKHSGYFETNKGERNITLLIKELEINPQDPYYLFQLGKELRINGQYERAFYNLMRAYNNTIDKSINNTPYYGELVVELINSGKEIMTSEVLRIIDANEETLKNLTDFHFAKGLFYLDFCLSFPDQIKTYMLEIENSFLTCLKLGEHEHYEFLQGTSTYLAAYNLGVYYEVIGNTKKAIYYYKLSYNSGYYFSENRLKKLLNKT